MFHVKHFLSIGIYAEMHGAETVANGYRNAAEGLPTRTEYGPNEAGARRETGGKPKGVRKAGPHARSAWRGRELMPRLIVTSRAALTKN
jgi:hypothetical protein